MDIYLNALDCIAISGLGVCVCGGGEWGVLVG